MTDAQCYMIHLVLAAISFSLGSTAKLKKSALARNDILGTVLSYPDFDIDWKYTNNFHSFFSLTAPTSMYILYN